MEDGGTVTISTSDSGETLSVLVEDNGCGMSKETLRRFYEPFFPLKSRDMGQAWVCSSLMALLRGSAGRSRRRAR
ncbi:MAG: ATP-binding protein [Syntrophobacteraceae bacterium]